MRGNITTVGMAVDLISCSRFVRNYYRLSVIILHLMVTDRTTMVNTMKEFSKWIWYQ